MKDKEKRERIVMLDKPPVLELTSVESYYLNSLVVTESTILEYLRLPRFDRVESKAKESTQLIKFFKPTLFAGFN